MKQFNTFSLIVFFDKTSLYGGAYLLFFCIIPPLSVANLFWSWCKQGGKENRLFLLTYITTTFCWSIFGWQKTKLFLIIVNLKTLCMSYYEEFIHHWSKSQHYDDKKEHIIFAYRMFESAAIAFFTSHGWPYIFRIKN